MIAATWLVVLSCVAQAAPASAWADRLAAAWSGPAAERLNSTILGDVFTGVLDIQARPGRHCQPDISISMPPSGGLSLQAALIGFPDRKACPASIPVSILNMGVKTGSASDVQTVKSALRAALPAVCFDGVLPSDGRRHATPPHMTAWADPHRLLTFVWEDFDPTVFTVTYVRRDLTLPDPGEQEAYTRIRDSILHPIPAGCFGRMP